MPPAGPRISAARNSRYAEVKAIASGNPAVLTLAEADAELQRLTLLKKNHLDEQYVARHSVRDLPETIASLSERLTKLDDGRGHRRRSRRRSDHHRQPHLVTRGRARLPRRQTGCHAENVRDTTRVPIGIYRGLRFGLVLHPQFPPDVYLEGAIDPPIHRFRGTTRDRVPS